MPLIVYQGPGRWASPVQLLDLIDLAPADKQAAQAWLPRFEFLLDDLSRVSDVQGKARSLRCDRRSVAAGLPGRKHAVRTRTPSGPPCTWRSLPSGK